MIKIKFFSISILALSMFSGIAFGEPTKLDPRAGFEITKSDNAQLVVQFEPPLQKKLKSKLVISAKGSELQNLKKLAVKVSMPDMGHSVSDSIAIPQREKGVYKSNFLPPMAGDYLFEFFAETGDSIQVFEQTLNLQ